MAVAQLRSPIILVHGLCGFDKFRVGAWTIAEYFPGIPAILGKVGNRVLTPCLSPTRGIADRAAQLKRFLNRQSRDEPVHIIAHSMGGLDARYMISRLGMSQRVLSLTTLGTPHRGTSFADWGIRRFARIFRPLLHVLTIPTRAFEDLTTTHCRRFNSEVPDQPNVRYFSVAGEYNPKDVRPEWMLSYRIVSAQEGPNDGVVSVASATYGESLGVWPGDHLLLANWNNFVWPAVCPQGDSSALYVKIINRLADEGY